MADSHSQSGQGAPFGTATNAIIDKPIEAGAQAGEPGIVSKIESHDEAVKDQVDGAVPKGPKKADATTGGRVMVGEKGDLHDLAAKRGL